MLFLCAVHLLLLWLCAFVGSSRPPIRPVIPTTVKSQRKKVLVLMSDTGGGHRASAIALDQALSDLYPKRMDVEICDIWTDHAGWPFNRFVPSYRFMAKNPVLWRIMYAYGQFPPTKFFTEVLSWYWCYSKFAEVIRKADPAVDVVVSVHPLCQHIPIPVVRKMNKNRDAAKNPISFVTIVTDLGGAHPTWFDKRTDFCFVPSKAVYKIATQNGMPPEKLVMHGLPIRPSFWKPSPPKEKVRKVLGLRDVRTALVMGGGDGVGNLVNIATELAKKLQQSAKESQVVVVCGHNDKVAKQLEARAWPANVNMVVKGFMSNIDEYMSASDCLVTKAGPGTIAEAMIRGLPLVLSTFLPGQEAGNVPYVIEGGFGVYAKNNPRKIASTVFSLFEDDGLMKSMSSNAKVLSRPEATREIAKDVGALALRSKHESIPKFKDTV